MRKQAAALEAGRLADEAKRLYEQRHAVEQENLKSSLVSHVSQSEYLVRRLTRLASSANNALDVAEQEFAEGVFAPFWDAVESAVKALANFSEEADAIVNHVRQYRTEAAMLVGTPPQFKVDIHTLPDASQVAKRMHSIVRRAQKSPHFAMIYEQRKTNQLLVAGFSNLAHAISGLGDRLERSLGYLTSEISDLASAQREATETLADELQHLREQNSEESDARRKHEEQEREMLDNIQRRRKPR